MSAVSIVLTGVSWSAPDGRSLFSKLDLSLGRERVGLVGRNGVGKTTLLRIISGELSPQAGSIAVQGQLATMRQNLSIDPGETIADLFGVGKAMAILDRASAGSASDEDLSAADWMLEGRIALALSRVGLDADPHVRLASLSGGQRTRAALAARLFAEPDILILDEPTNHLDAEGRQAVADLLADWKGAALVVSHDRRLLEGMDALVELTSMGPARFGGGWSAYRARKAAELAAAESDLAEAERQIDQISQSAQRQSERQARRDGAGRRKGARGDMPRIAAGLLKRRAEETGASHARLVGQRLGAARITAEAARSRIEVLAPLSVNLPATGLAPGRTVLRLDAVSAGYSAARPIFTDLSLAVTGPERIAIRGPNGAGKSTLLSIIDGSLAPLAGTVERGCPCARLDQEVSLLDPGASLIDNFRRLNPRAGGEDAHAALARLGFRAEAALARVEELSAGQALRAGLACVLGGSDPPPLLLLDEPTNHLDLAGIEAVEAGLAAYDGSLLVISHDEAFLEAIGVERSVVLTGRNPDRSP